MIGLVQCLRLCSEMLSCESEEEEVLWLCDGNVLGYSNIGIASASPAGGLGI